MSLLCCVSGAPMEEPVVSKTSGLVYERRIIEKQIKANGRCPVTQNELSMEDLVPLKVDPAVQVRPSGAASVPGMLTMFQNEWDALMLETFTLKQHLDTVRQELCNSLYQHDAACRVIARLTKERDEARKALVDAQRKVSELAANGVSSKQSAGAGAGAQAEAGAGAGADGMDTGSDAIPKEDVDKMAAKAAELSAGRRKRHIPDDLASEESLGNFSVLSSHNLHKSNKPGILCMDIHRVKSDLVATGGLDHNGAVFNRQTGKSTGTLAGHKGAVASIAFQGDSGIVTASEDHTVKAWTPGSKKDYTCVHTYTNHSDKVTGLSVHPCSEYFVSCSADDHWAFQNAETGATLASFAAPEASGGLSCCAIHPDGMLMSTGSVQKSIRLWDLKAQSSVATFNEHTGPVKSLTFSENGYIMVSVSEDDTLRVWDLRKLACTKVLQLDEGFGAASVSFDLSGKYLAVAGRQLQVFAAKGWRPVVTLDEHKEPLSAAMFGPSASFLASVSKDRSLKFWGLSE